MFFLIAIGVFYAAGLFILVHRNRTLRERHDAETRRRAAMTPEQRDEVAYQDRLDRFW